MIHIEGLTKRYGDRTLLEDVSWHVKKRDRIGLSGPNGAGKTTLLRMLAGLEEPDAGQIRMASDTTIGYLPQDGIVHRGRTVHEEVSYAFAELLALKEEQHRIEDQLAHDGDGADHEKLLARYAEVTERFKDRGGWEIDARVADVLKGLGFSLDDQQRKCEEFSGGWQMRIALAKLLLARPNLLLMDEPTNHLDLPARNWLEEYLADYPGSVVLVSHDRYFLDATVKRITEVGLRTLTDYHGNYSKYVVEHTAAMDRLREAHRRQSEEIEKAEAFINRFRYQATKARQVQSRIKQLDKVERIEIPPARKKIRFKFPDAPKPGRVVLELKGVRKAYGDKVVLGSVDLMIERGDRIALVGPNGAGKSTLMRILAAVDRPDSGARLEGHRVMIDYFAQDQAAVLNATCTVYEEMSTTSPNTMVPMIRTILGGFLFSGDDVEQEGRGALGRRAKPPRPGQDAAAAEQPAPPGRAHEPPRPRFQGGPARRPRRLRGHPHLRVPRPLLRGPARHQGHRGGRGRGPALSRRLRGLPLLEEAAGGRARGAAPEAATVQALDRGRHPGAGGAGHAARCFETGCVPPAAAPSKVPHRSQLPPPRARPRPPGATGSPPPPTTPWRRGCARRRPPRPAGTAGPRAGAQEDEGPPHRAREADRREGEGGQGARGRHGLARLLRGSRARRAGGQRAQVADVGSRRPDAAVGDAAGRGGQRETAFTTIGR